MSEWSLHFHRTLKVAGGTKEMDVFSLRKSGAAPVVVMAEHANKEHIAHRIARKMNLADASEPNPPQELLEIYGMFHGPWKEGTITFSEKEARRIKHALFREAAGRTSLEHQYQTLQDDFSRLRRRNEIVEQELLRLRGSFQRADTTDERPDTIADLLADTEVAEELPFEHSSQVLCARGGCGEL